MRNGRFITSKCRGKLQKMWVLYTPPPPKKPRPLLHARASKKIIKKKRTIKYFKKLAGRDLSSRCRPALDHWLQAGGQPKVSNQQLVGLDRPATSSCSLATTWALFFVKLPTPFLFSCPHFFPHVVNSCSLAPAHARPAQTSPKIFKHP
jgi:hypothetical protein